MQLTSKGVNLIVHYKMHFKPQRCSVKFTINLEKYTKIQIIFSKKRPKILIIGFIKVFDFLINLQKKLLF